MECKKCGCCIFDPNIYPVGAHCSKCGQALTEEEFNKLCEPKKEDK